jgi:hypothetical protein
MKTVISSFLAFLLIGLSFSCSVPRDDLYVMLTGDDSNTGTKSKPLRSLQKVKEAVRQKMLAENSSTINVWIGGGTYNLTESLVFNSDDSGPADGFIAYCGMPGETVEISGGIEITGWKKAAKGLWVTSVKSPGTGKSEFRELFIDGVRAVRARHPNEGYLLVAEAGTDRRTNFRYTKNDFPLPSDPTRVELVLLHDWSITRINLASIDSLKDVITAKDSTGARDIDFFNIDNWEKNPRYFLENSMEFLDNEMEWYYDQAAGLLYLKLNENQSPENKKVVMPLLPDNLIRLQGDENKKISNIRFENLTFSYCSWAIPENGYAGIQACHFDPRPRNNEWNVVPAAVDAAMAENCSFINCRFTHLGGSGLRIGRNCGGCLVSGCYFADISGNGIMVGEGNDRIVDGDVWWKNAPDQAASGNMIGNSVITECGRQFFGAVGIWCGLAAKTSILDNHIFNLPYTGISSGWLWNPEPTPCRENRIEGNHIHHVMQVLSDGGGIYMLGLQPGTLISGNLIHDIPLNAGRAESNGMFLDEGITSVEVSENIIYKVAKSPLRFHKATVNLVKNNILSCSGSNPPVRYNNTPVESIVLEDNKILHEDNSADMAVLETAVKSWESKHK